jgi:hypothetical protein
MTARAIGVFALVLAMASPALAGPKNSVIGAGKLEEDMVHSGGTGYPVTLYEWWNKGKGKMDWGLSGELVYDDWTAASAGGGTRAFGVRVRGGKIVKIGLGINGNLRWTLSEKEKPKVTNRVAILAKPGILIGGNTGSTFVFGIRGEVGAPVSIDVHERVSVVTGGFVPLTFFINKDATNSGWIPLLIRMGVEIKANDNVAPWFYFDLGPGIGFGLGSGSGGANASFAWRIGAGTAFWGVLGKNKNKSNSAEAEEVEVVEVVVAEE